MVSGHTSPAKMFQLVEMLGNFQRDVLETQMARGKDAVNEKENLVEWKEWEGFVGAVAEAVVLRWDYHELWQKCLVLAGV